MPNLHKEIWQLQKNLFAVPTKKIIAGVASGLADYLDIDVTVIRIGFILTSIFWGVGFWAYVIIWLFVPDSDDNVLVNLSSKEKVKDAEFEEMKKKDENK
ncbi:hypothetical protein COY25_01980 [Candidatus Uhrbacteria bacterium CG_4_10_14_0_2_um_filter_41_7]|uniref:Phage shock protein PspC N-terminal domain-containing protein n=1 Tax=Candidatus Uhrbacteria bacterium CG_4_9_14_3_um_filter_41_35 TaxID=1975034 RepID=A0A2M7XFY2_9BACT|nr:MAG: hypothetical protein COV92_02890 [Candidatus Uhrbacteria bacterium CG11_big_fil_rev_8_21_14_0_20_41_9]PIZ54597.1 MAG: hypothetical protein COY25_01980 [Candidatus Uhrbacteria bacterium CG_4_10_14_0_2_um_filter_41_7]PJA46771.1 MAG: hypothetical protein CO173_01535 [Candidatus Uhrbacteria bacterium CG_4_9_14_3_um_filter_41_35]